jgi:TRAP-type C4-dicarboxylate transport system permease small subunit
MPEMDVNYAAVITATIFCFILGAFWYSSLMFGRQWLAALGKSEDDLKKGGGFAAYLLSFVGWLLATYVLANIINFSGANTLGNGMIIGFLCWLGFTAAMTLMHNMFEKRGASLWLVNSGYTLVGFLISGAMFGVWK